MTQSSPEVAAEQAYLDHAQACLKAMRARAARNVEIGTRRAREEPSVDTSLLLEELERRLASLADSPVALAFGRLDEEAGERFYVGRRHVEDARGDAVVVDWRAAVSVPFYRATWADPMGVERRRRFALDGPELVGLFDEDFGDPDAERAGGGGGVPDPLLAELERARTGEMRDIVATIQAEQDEVIRAPLGECLVVQGGPGTGKTAVGLHRAAFLLYEHRTRFERERLLVVGPNPLFLRYIAQVLPSLGETAVAQTTVPGLLESRFRIRATEPDAVATLKGDARMAGVIGRAARAGLVVEVSEAIGLSVLGTTLRLPAADVQAVLDAVHARGLPLRAGREQLQRRLSVLALNRFTELRPSVDESDVTAALREGKELTAAVQRLWPVPSAAVLVRRLLGNRRVLAAAAEGLLDPGEQSLLFRKPAAKQAEEQWTRADLALLDEAEFVVGGPPRAFGHVVVDEAQDHSAMELRMLGRRSPSRSMTILGDLAQATGTGAQSRWDDALGSLGAVARTRRRARARLPRARTGARARQPVAAVRRARGAAEPLRARDGRTADCRALRDAGRDPGCRRRDGVRRARRQERSVGVVAPEARLDAIADALRIGKVDFADGRKVAGLSDAVTLVPPESAKGLEFDAVIVVEPAEIAAIGEHGLRLLYIALTRAVRTLTLVHAADLPAPLR